MKNKPGKNKNIRRIGLSFLIIFGSYLFFCLAITLLDFIHMVNQDRTATAQDYGQSRYELLLENRIDVAHKIYSDDEIKEVAARESVNLYYFPNDTGKKTGYIIICPGGAYMYCNIEGVGFPTAATINDMGYTSFVLEYRTGKLSSKYAPLEDLVTAIKYITENADNFNVEVEYYAIVGFSAGGNLAGLFGTDLLGYKNYADIKKPAALILAYPWININDWYSNLSPNLIENIIIQTLTFMGNRYMLGIGASREEKLSLCVQRHITADYPPTFIYQGERDFLTRAEAHSDLLVESFKKYNVPYQYELYKDVNHGGGIGLGTSGEGWINNAIEFWLDKGNHHVSP